MANRRGMEYMDQAMRPKNTSTQVVREEDGYLHFKSRERPPLPTPSRKSNQDEDSHYTYVKTVQPKIPEVRERTSTYMIEEPMRKTPVFSRKGLVITALVLVCAVAAAVLGTYFFMKNNNESCSCVTEGLSSSVTDRVSGLSSNTTNENPTFTTTSKTVTTKKNTNVTSLVPNSTTAPTTTTTALPTSTISINTACLQRFRVIPHPTECQAFYNCSLTVKKKYNYPSIYYDECSYPHLFNTATLSCDHFDNVECGTRKETKTECEYRSGRCFENCVLCGPTCSGLTDGRNPYPGREWTFYFIICYKERLCHTGTCKQDERGMPSLFNPITNDCVTIDKVPRENGGWMPNCTGKAYGTYSNPYAAGSFYFICKDGKYIDYLVCPDGGIFNETARQCIYS